MKRNSMYIPASFRETDLTRLHEFIEGHSFATLVAPQAPEPVASHLPLLLDRDLPPRGRLIGHMAKAIAQWRWAAGQSALAIFHGPHAYISPSWYEVQNVVPTWNYVAVHAYGTLRLVEDRHRTLDVLRRTVAFFESGRSQPWLLEAASPEFINQLLDAIVAFEIDLQRLEGKWKLSQNHPPERRAKVIVGLNQHGGHDERRIAAEMAAREEQREMVQVPGRELG